MRKLLFLVLAVIVIIGASASVVMAKAAGPHAGAGNVIKDGSKVSFDYTLTVDGKVVDSSEGKKPLEFTEGDGKIIPGLAKQLQGLKAGDEKIITVLPKEAYGVSDPKAVKEVPLKSFPPDLKPKIGMQLAAKAPNGETFPVKIAEVKKDSLMIDFNHPLADKTLTFKIKVVSVS